MERIRNVVDPREACVANDPSTRAGFEHRSAESEAQLWGSCVVIEKLRARWTLSHLRAVQNGQIEKGRDRLFEGEEAVFHVMPLWAVRPAVR